MPEARTLDYLEGLDALYIDNLEWKFYEGGKSIKQAPHGVRLSIVKPPDDKLPSIIIEFRVVEEEDSHWMKLRLSVYEFVQLNDLFKRASFRLEKI